MDKPPSIWSFTLSFRKHLFAAMSGGFSIPFVAVAAWVDNIYAKVIFVALAFASAWFAAYMIWKGERGRVVELEEKLRPKLKWSFRMNDPLCVRPNTIITTYFANPIAGRQNMTIQPSTGIQILSSIEATYYRIKVEADCLGSISNCCGYLLAIEKDGAIIFDGETPLLPFTPALDPDATAKTIRAGVPALLDFLYITANNEVRLPIHGAKSSSVNFDKLIAQNAKYVLRIVVTSADSIPINIVINLNWNGDRNTAELSPSTTL